MDSISEIEEVGEINRYLITRGLMDRIKKGVRNIRGHGTAEAQLKKKNKKAQGTQEASIKKIHSLEADNVEREDQVGVLTKEIKKTNAEIKAEKQALKDSEEHEMKLTKDGKNNEKKETKETERRSAHKQAMADTKADKSDESDTNEKMDEDDDGIAEEAQQAAQEDNNELKKKSKKHLTRANTVH